MGDEHSGEAGAAPRLPGDERVSPNSDAGTVIPLGPAPVARKRDVRPTRSPDAVTPATKASLSSLAHRVADLEAEIADLDAMITPLLKEAAPELLGVYGVGIDTGPYCSSPLATTQSACTQKPPGPTCTGSHRSRPSGKVTRPAHSRWGPPGQPGAVTHRDHPTRL